MSNEPIRLRLTDARFYMRNVRLRMPFRYGAATLIGYPILHARVSVEMSDGMRAEGVSADCLPPKWFDKSPDKNYEDNIRDMLFAVQAAHDAYLELASEPRTPFELMMDGLSAAMEARAEGGINELTASFGASFFERAAADAVCNALSLSFFEALQSNVLGVEMGAAHSELEGLKPSDVLPSSPLDSLWIRHTVGLSDPILTSEIDQEERLNDGLPQSLEEYIDAQKLRYFKVKVCGDDSVDLPRLQTIAELLDARASGLYVVSLDGNEQYVEAAPFRSLVETLRTKPVFEQFFNSIRYIEQPIHRDAALKPSLAEEMRELSSVKPVIIDESDSGLDTFKQALEIGYRGVSSKNCKGVYKSLLNYALAKRGGHLMTGEDLANAPVVPLHQDCATLAALGISDAERNGHHYLRGLAHLSRSERADCLEAHPRMYAVKGGLPQLNVEGGRIDIRSLQTSGYALGAPVDYRSMTPLEEWTFDSLSL